MTIDTPAAPQPPDDDSPTHPDYSDSPRRDPAEDTDWTTPADGPEAMMAADQNPIMHGAESATEPMDRPEEPEPLMAEPADLPIVPAPTAFDEVAALEPAPTQLDTAEPVACPTVEPADLPPPAAPAPLAVHTPPLAADDEEIDLATPPPIDPTSPGSGWFDISGTRLAGGQQHPLGDQPSGDALSGGLTPSASDLIGADPASTGSGSDVIRGLFAGGPGPESHIFGALGGTQPPELIGSDELPTDEEIITDPLRNPTPSEVRLGPLSDTEEEITDLGGLSSSDEATKRQTVEQLFAELAAADIPMPTKFRPQARSSDPGSDPHAPDFSELDHTQSGSNLFADPTAPDVALPGSSSTVGPPSGLDMHSPFSGPASGKLTGPRSSIFSHDDEDDESRVNVDQIPKMGSSDDATEAFPLPDRPPPSHIFTDIPSSPLHDMLASGIHPAPSGSDKDVLEANAGKVSFDMPRSPSDPTALAEASGMIDWSVPPMDDDLPSLPGVGPSGAGLLDKLAEGLESYRPGGPASGVDLTQPESMFELELGEEAASISGRRRQPPELVDQITADELTLPTGPDGFEAPVDFNDPAEITDPAELTDVTPTNAIEEVDVIGGPISARAQSQPRSATRPPSSKGMPRQTTFRGRQVDQSSATSFSVIDVKAEADLLRKRRGDRIGGAVIGLIAGVAVCAIAYVGGVVPGGLPPAKSGGTDPAPVAAVSTDDAKKLLAAGEPAQALAALEQAPADAPAEVKAARGEARWLARLRELAAAGNPVSADDSALKLAEADLSAAAAEADPAAAVRAALHLGLMKEMTGDVAGARKVYADAAAKFPASKPVFDAALNRLRAMAGPDDRSALAPRPAADLARVVLLALVMLQAPADEPAPPPDEPGFHFWQAVADASASRYTEALAGIAQARKLHDQKRLLSAGRSAINPLSDPLDQVFLKCCDEIQQYWTLRRELYEHPQLGEVVKKDGVTKALKELANLTESAKEYPAKLADLREELAKATADMASMRAETGKLDAENKALADDLAVAKAELADKVARVKAADEQLAAVVAELKANGHLQDGEEGRLSAVVKSVAAAAASGEAKTATEAMLAARRDADTARAEAKAAADKVADLISKLDAQGEQAREAVAAARRTAAAEAVQRERDLRDRLAAADELRRRELAAQEEKFARMLADVRLRAKVPESTGERFTRQRAMKAYADGYALYLAGRFAEAEARFAAATADDPGDARYWYFLGLARWVQGDTNAEDAFRKGAELEARGRPSAEQVGAALERIQGPARSTLATFRP